MRECIFIHFADTLPEEEAARARQIRYYQECAIPALPGDPKTAPPSYRYFIGMVERLRNVRPQDLTENSVLLGSAAHITDTLIARCRSPARTRRTNATCWAHCCYRCWRGTGAMRTSRHCAVMR